MTKPIIKWVPYRPSNGTEGAEFEEEFCDRCIKDRDSDCPIHAKALIFDEEDPSFPKEWVIDDMADSWPGNAKCTAFEPYPKEVPW